MLLPCGRVIDAHTNELEDFADRSAPGADQDQDPYGVNSACAACLGAFGQIVVPRMLAANLNPTDPMMAGRLHITLASFFLCFPTSAPGPLSLHLESANSWLSAYSSILDIKHA